MNISLKNPKIANEHIELYFTTNAEHINDLIESEPCVLTVKGPRGASATAEIDNATLLAEVCYLRENKTAQRLLLKFYSKIDFQNFELANFFYFIIY